MKLRPYQEAHFKEVLAVLQRRGAALDASDTGTGKTYVAVALAAALGHTPFVVGPFNGRAGWEAAAASANIGIEYVNYEKLRGRRVWATAPCPICRENRKPFLGPFRQRLPAETDWAKEVFHGKGSLMRWKNNYALLIFDEVHRCGGATSLNSKLLIAGKRQAGIVLAISATAADDPRQMKALGFTLGLHGLSRKEPVPYVTWLLQHGCTPGVFGGFDFTANEAKTVAAFKRVNAEIFPSRGARMRKAEIPGFPKTTIDTLLLFDETGKAQKIADKLHGLDQTKKSSLGDVMHCREALELLKVPHFVDRAKDAALTSKVVLFFNFTKPLLACVAALRKEFGADRVGVIYGEQTEAERLAFLSRFKNNDLEALVCNSQAAGENADMHDPTGQVERTTLISPCESGRRFKQLVGRVNRDGGAFSLQLIGFFKGTREEVVADRMQQKGMNIDLFNDADLLV